MKFFFKKGIHIRATFERVLSDVYGINYKKDYYVIADRASENPVAFGRRYLICWAHALDLAFKQGIKELTDQNKDCTLVVSLNAMSELTTYCKTRNIKLTYVHTKNNRKYEAQLHNPSK